MRRAWEILVGFVFGAVLGFAAQGCAATPLARAKQVANAAYDIGEIARVAIHDACTLEYVEATSPARVAQLDVYCIPARKAFGAYRAVHAALEAAIRTAEARGDARDVAVVELEQRLTAAGDELSHALAAVPGGIR